MNRRGFLKMLAGAAVAIGAAPLLKLLPSPAKLARRNGPSAAELEFWKSRGQGLCFYDLRPGAELLFPNTPIRNSLVRYRELGIERGVTFTARPAGEGFSDNVWDEHIRSVSKLELGDANLADQHFRALEKLYLDEEAYLDAENLKAMANAWGRYSVKPTFTWVNPELMAAFAAKRSGGGSARQRRQWKRQWSVKEQV
jgi:hypothetical protein